MPISRPLWWRPWAKESALLLLLLLFALSATLHPPWQRATTYFKHTASPPSSLVPLTLLRNAQARGAVCLDGSSPGYHFQKGTGSGSKNWVLHIEGGGWCDSVVSCSSRKMTSLGSSKFMEKEVFFSGILSSEQVQNPDFFNWNKVKIRYCDGASLSGLVEDKDKDKSNMFFKGQLIWEAVMGELLDLGLSNAKQALLSGCSAGGLATLIHCDNFRDELPKTASVKCLADAAFFLDEEDVSGKRTMRSFYQRVVSLQGGTANLPRNCTSKIEPYKCFFPREIVRITKTPVFIVQPAYDFWQIQNILVPYGSDADDNWQACKRSIQECSSNQLDRLQEYRSALLNHLSDFQESKDGGIFINSCFIHCQTWISDTWHSANSPRVNNMVGEITNTPTGPAYNMLEFSMIQEGEKERIFEDAFITPTSVEHRIWGLPRCPSAPKKRRLKGEEVADVCCCRRRLSFTDDQDLQSLLGLKRPIGNDQIKEASRKGF